MGRAKFFILFFIFILFYGALGVNLYELQIEKGDYYIGKVNAMRERIAELELRRGQIFVTDRSGTKIPLALNKDYPVIFASPNEIEDDAGTARLMADLFNLDQKDLLSAFGNKKSYFKSLVDKATDAQVSKIAELALPGIHVETKQYRYYPFERLGSQLLGFVGVNKNYDEPVGLYGMEKFANEELREGNDMYLTIDRNIQAQSEQILEDLMKEFEAVGGTIIVQNPKTGEILAIANKPDFNPNEYGKSSISSFLNAGVQLVYEPGSVMKPITMAAGIDSESFTPDTSYTDKGTVTLNGKTIHNAQDKVYGKVTMTEVIENSINTGAVYAESLMGHDIFYNYLEKFGFSGTSGIDLPDEVSGNITNLASKNARAVDFATASFGQGVALTPISLVNAFSAIANGGLLMKPYISKDEDPYIVRRVIEKDTANQVAKMIESTVTKAKIAAIPNYRIAGKTGTAFIPDFKKGGYSEEMIHTFVGFAPVSNPQFTVLIKLDKPKVGELAGLTVVRAFKRLSQFLINYYNIPPDKFPETQ